MGVGACVCLCQVVCVCVCLRVCVVCVCLCACIYVGYVFNCVYKSDESVCGVCVSVSYHHLAEKSVFQPIKVSSVDEDQLLLLLLL